MIHSPPQNISSLVCGASRGVGRGIAHALGAAGAVVVVTGRSSEAGPRTDGRPENIEDVAREVTAAGGKGYPYRCDHTSAREVDGLLQWTRRRLDTLDLVVCSVWSGQEGYDGERYPDGSRFGTPFWRRPATRLADLMGSGVGASLLLAKSIAPLMVAQGKGLLIFVAYDPGDGYAGDLFYDLSMAAIRRLAFGCAQELSGTGVTTLALSPGFVRTERATDCGLADQATESPVYTGRAVVALAGDPDVRRLNGQSLHVADLADHYGFTDFDGTRPKRFELGN